MIASILGHKGGVGKSTLATNLAVLLRQQGDLLLLDADRQGSSAGWASLRDEEDDLPTIQCVQRFGKIHKALPELEERYSAVLVDCGGRDGEEGRSSLLVADLAILPMLPAQFDLWVLEEVVEQLDTARTYNERLQAVAVFNRCSTHPRGKEVEEARAYLEEQNIRLADAVIRDRVAFRRAAREGRAVTELKPADPKAAAEVTAFYEEVFANVF